MCSPEKDQASVCGAGPDHSTQTPPNSAQSDARAQDDEKAFRTAQALAAMEGFGLLRDGGELLLTRWNLARSFRSTDDVLAFLAGMGRRP